MRHWKHWQSALGVLVGIVLLIASYIGITFWRERHEALTERVRLRVVACEKTSSTAVNASVRIISARLEDDQIYSYHFSYPDRCTVLLDLPDRRYINVVAQELTGNGNVVVYGMGNLAPLVIGAHMPQKSHGECDAPPPCVLLTGNDLDRGAISTGHDNFGQPTVSFAVNGSIAEYSQTHIGQSMAFEIDDRVILDATIQQSITSTAVISNLGDDEASRIASILRHPQLPTSLALVAVEPLVGHQ